MAKVNEYNKKQKYEWIKNNAIHPFFVGEIIDGNKRTEFYVTTQKSVTTKVNAYVTTFKIHFENDIFSFKLFQGIDCCNYKLTDKYIKFANKYDISCHDYLIDRFLTEENIKHEKDSQY